jgi:uncharacterized phage protein gp47/JayE
MSSSGYIDTPIMSDSQTIMQNIYTYLQAKIPGWTPADGNLDVWLIEAFANEAADIRTLASGVPKSIFRYLGASLFGIIPIDAVSASCFSTWTLTDNLGHTIPAGTQVGIRNSNGDLIPFATTVDVIVPGGSSSTPANSVLLLAVNQGSAASGLGSISGNIELIDSIAWVSSISQTAVTSGGVDAETDDAYLNRLSFELRTVSPRPILPVDFAILARNVAGVQRATVLDGYNTADSTFGNQRMVTVFSVDSTGTAVGSTVKSAVIAYLESLREVNFVVNVADVSSVEIDVTVSVVQIVGYDPGDVATRVKAAIENFLNPSTWGADLTDNASPPITWTNRNTVYYLELATVINNVAGVDRVATLTLGSHGGAQAALDYVMSGLVPLPKTTNSDVIVTVT